MNMTHHTICWWSKVDQTMEYTMEQRGLVFIIHVPLVPVAGSVAAEPDA